MSPETNGFYTDINRLIEDTSIGIPHVVILGAGASIQALPTGDINGYRLPSMNDLVDMLRLNTELDKYNIKYDGSNFEDIYSELYERNEFGSLIGVINQRIRDYFSTLRLPSNPTIYDHLVLSLRGKDLIATFNWDPFLYLACFRNHDKAELPRVVYLHGNVAIGYCLQDMSFGWINMKCKHCGNNYIPSQLLYPIKKDYSQDPFIKIQWDGFKNALQKAYVLTIFGYGAPQSDKLAVDIIKESCIKNPLKTIAQVEIIDAKPVEDIRDTWSGLIYDIYNEHYNITADFYESSIPLFPRRTCETDWNYHMPKKLEFYPQNPIPKNLGFEELWAWYAPLLKAEEGNSEQ